MQTIVKLKNIFYGENQSFLQIERFKKIHGSGEGQMVDKADAPVYVRMYKADTVDENGNKAGTLCKEERCFSQGIYEIKYM